ncbi:unnamed protein product [marine sediment metagenome]|uniref:Uncharacterized protein n=1 Tax=marine sediment metagenome TaxID=412755 RepID=X1BLL8_9ZZZZ
MLSGVNNMNTMEIFFSSLTGEAQAEYIGLFGHDDNVKADAFPIAMIDRESEDN